MPTHTVAALIPVIQTAISPFILISGVGLLLLSMTNRLGRVVDRSRALAASLHQAPAENRKALSAQILVLWRRARLLQAAISLSTISALISAVLIGALFIAALFQLQSAWLLSLLLILALVALGASLVVFSLDIAQALTALKIELGLNGGAAHADTRGRSG